MLMRHLMPPQNGYMHLALPRNADNHNSAEHEM